MDTKTRFRKSVGIIGLDSSQLKKLSDEMGLGLSQDELHMLQSYFQDLHRDPTDIELQAMAQAWSEHCCYKSSKFYLKKYLSGLKTPYTILAMEDDAGVVEFDSDHSYVVKMESHNHPSAVEPYGGAATGVGGILRDVLCMGAQPVALVDSLYFGKPDEPVKGGLSTRYIMNGIVSGIRDYGNRVGIPTVAGSIDFDGSFSGIPLVNVGCVGIMKKENLSRSRISKIGDLLVLAGGRTGRDGIHGVNFASKSMSGNTEESKRAIQLGNPIIKEPLIHAVLEANEAGLIDGMKDLGGGGLSSSAGEICFAGGTSAEIDLANVILKEDSMEPWEIWVSESQERMLLAIDPSNLQKLKKIFELWDVEYSVIGTVKEGENLILKFHGEEILNLDLSFLTSGPMYCRNFIENKVKANQYLMPPEPSDLNEFVVKFMSSYLNSSRFPVTRQYDHTVRGNTVVGPEQGYPNHETHSDCAIIKPVHTSFRGLGITSGSLNRMVKIDPYNGTLHTMCEAYRNLVAARVRPHAVVDSLNFGNPEEPEVMGQLVSSVRAIGDFCRRFSLPIVAGNVSLYNQSAHKNIKPTPTIMMTGIIDDVRNYVPSFFTSEGKDIYVIGEPQTNLGGSVYLEFLGMEGQSIAPLDLKELEKITYVLEKIQDSGIVEACHDISQGGLFSSICEMSFGNRIGVKADISWVSGERTVHKLFAEGGNRFIVQIDRKNEEQFLKEVEGIHHTFLGTTDGDRIIITDDGRERINIEIEKIMVPWEKGLEEYF
ncbi:phosphoribosylformylglycinamidine synthase subunit PurL [Oxyplasma meridianum]|uniref:Phosphoribosylformylglycinamidine synthase subunit PurL n=1 Tax=Oxyplasma meridianum TaxID=3073602 RepID=A0AAX4NHT5_9ARCH